jgi:hypothetical protein
MLVKDSFKTLLAAGALAFMAGGASAATVLTVDDSYPGITPYAGTATCLQTCAGLVAVGPSVWATDGAKLFAVNPPNDTNEKNFVNSATGSSFGNGTKTEVANGDNYSFFTDALYILMKIGGGGGSTPATFLIHNTFGQGLKITWNSVSGGGNGLSHYNEFGTALPPVPLPATGVLLIGALGGLAAVRRRRRAA